MGDKLLHIIGATFQYLEFYMEKWQNCCGSILYYFTARINLIPRILSLESAHKRETPWWGLVKYLIDSERYKIINDLGRGKHWEFCLCWALGIPIMDELKKTVRIR